LDIQSVITRTVTVAAGRFSWCGLRWSMRRSSSRKRGPKWLFFPPLMTTFPARVRARQPLSWARPRIVVHQAPSAAPTGATVASLTAVVNAAQSPRAARGHEPGIRPRAGRQFRGSLRCSV